MELNAFDVVNYSNLIVDGKMTKVGLSHLKSFAFFEI